jgi:hypothetical protein
MTCKLSILGGAVTVFGLVSGGCSDSPVDRLDDEPASCTAETRVYRITSVDPSLRVAHTIDLDDDARPDDALGQAHDMIAGVDAAFAVAPRIGARLATEVPWLVAIDRCGTDVRVTIDEGMVLPGDATPLMPKQLPRAVGQLRDGTDGGPRDGALNGAVIDARDGQLHLPLATLADASNALPPRWVLGDALTIRATVAEGASGETLDGVFGAAIDRETARAELAPPIAAFLTAQPADDVLRLGADGDRDGIVTAAEVTATGPFANATAGDVHPTAPDGTPRFDAPAVSLALRFHAVRIR